MQTRMDVGVDETDGRGGGGGGCGGGGEGFEELGGGHLEEGGVVQEL